MAKKDKKVTNKENNNKDNKNKKSFFKGLKAELKKVIWPTPKQLLNNTVAVITIVLITAIIVFVLDLAFESLNKYGIDKIKSSIQTMQSTDSEDSSNTTENADTENSTDTTEGTDTENESTTDETTDTNTVDETVDENQTTTENSVE